jgi:EmrB/QacA subfamily drug resistance transporter
MPSFSQQGAASLSGSRKLALWTVLTAQLMLQMDFLIVIVALPKIQQDLGFNTAELSWVPNAFALAFGGLLLLGGRLGDIIGQVRAFRLGLAIFVLASLMGGLAETPLILIAARVLQGIGAALSGPSVLALVMVMARDDAERARSLSLFIAVSSIGASAGLILGGALTDFLSWRWSLLINAPVGLLIIAMVGRLVAETQPRPSSLDTGGALTATLGSVALVFGFINAAEHGWSDASTLISFVSAIVLFAVFLRIETSHKEPLLDLDLLRNRPRVAALVIMALIVGMHFSVLFILAQYLQRVLGLSPLLAGLAYVPLTVTVFAISQFVPQLISRFGPNDLLAAGSLFVSLSLWLFAFIDDTSDYVPGVLTPLLVHAIGIALVFAPGTVAIMHGIPDHQAGSASGLLQMDQQIGGALGIAIIASVYSSSAQPGHFVSGLSTAFLAAATIALISALIAVFTLGHERSTSSPTSEKGL